MNLAEFIESRRDHHLRLSLLRVPLQSNSSSHTRWLGWRLSAKKIHEIEPARSLFEITPLQEHLGEAFAETRLRTVLLAFFAITAKSLTCIVAAAASLLPSLRAARVDLRQILRQKRSG